MKSEQKVIKFPKNELKENKDRLDKLEVAYKMLKRLIGEGHDFHILIATEATKELFATDGLIKSDYGILTSNMEEAEEIRIKSDNAIFYPIKGDEII
jgi:hypothetical protein